MADPVIRYVHPGLNECTDPQAADWLHIVDVSATAGDEDRKVSVGKFGPISTGTWTPEISTVGGSGIVHGTRGGTYVKIGAFVMLSGYVSLTNKGTASGGLFIGGFPFTIGGESSTIYTWPVDWNGLAANHVAIIMQGGIGWSYGRLRGATAAAAALALLDASILTNTSSFVFTATYRV